MDIREFLQQRLAEDELLARCATRTETGPIRKGESFASGRWTAAERDRYSSAAVEDEAGLTVVYDEGAPTVAQAGHIARHDPARVLRDVEAKRRLIDDVLRYESKIDSEWGCCHDADEIGRGYCREIRPDEIEALRLLALPYVDHPDYREDWRP